MRRLRQAAIGSTLTTSRTLPRSTPRSAGSVRAPLASADSRLRESDLDQSVPTEAREAPIHLRIVHRSGRDDVLLANGPTAPARGLRYKMLMPLSGVPVLPPRGLIDGRVRLRALALPDVGLLQELSREPDVVRWTSYPADLDEDGARARIVWGDAAAERAVFCVAELDGRPAGTCGASVGATGAIEIFYAVLPWARRQGVAGRAASLLVSAASAAGAFTLSLTTHLDNVASQAVARRAGFVKVGQDHRVVKGVATQVELWQWEAGGK